MLYVASNSNSALPTFYRVAALWGAHEGSLLLWAWILAAWTLAVAIASRNLPASFASRVMGVLGFVSFGFLLFTVATSNPFERILPAPADGRDLNPVLQDPALAIHPPMLYMGYVGFAVAFAFACAAMLEGKLDQVWAKWTRPWTTMAWAFLSVGIALGSWWAYYELGWGGYWFWDPVENASFMPWLVGTALIHSLAATEKRGVFKSWTLLLAILAFSPELVRNLPGAFGRAHLGAFLRGRSDARPVHSRVPRHRDRWSAGAVRVARAAAEIAGGLRSHGARSLPALQQHLSRGRRRHGAGGHAGAADRGRHEAAAHLGGFTVSTMCCSRSSCCRCSRWWPSAYTPRGNAASSPTAAVASCSGSARRWSSGSPDGLFGYGPGKWLTPIGVVLGIWIILSSLFDPIDRLRRRLTLPRAIIGMTIAHIGLGVGVLAVSTVESYTVERDAAIAPGETLALGRYAYRFDSIKEIEGPNYDGVRAEVTVLRDGQPIDGPASGAAQLLGATLDAHRGRHRQPLETRACSWR